jgi:hypothetical protein
VLGRRGGDDRRERRRSGHLGHGLAEEHVSVVRVGTGGGRQPRPRLEVTALGAARPSGSPSIGSTRGVPVEVTVRRNRSTAARSPTAAEARNPATAGLSAGCGAGGIGLRATSGTAGRPGDLRPATTEC